MGEDRHSETSPVCNGYPVRPDDAVSGLHRRLAHPYSGSADKLSGHLKALLAGKEVVLTAVQFQADRQKVYRQRDLADYRSVLWGRDCPLCRLKVSLKTPDSRGELVGLGIRG